CPVCNREASSITSWRRDCSPNGGRFGKGCYDFPCGKQSENLPMRVGEIRTLAGPNVYSFRPVLFMKLFLDELAGKESREFPGFNELLLELMPGLVKHHCSKEREGGFIERLREGTYFGHVIEHVALELTELAGIPVYHGKTRSAEEPGSYNVIIEYK